GELRLQLPPPGQKEKEGRTIRVTFLLFLSRLGQVKADLEVSGNKVRGAIWTAGELTRRAVENRLERLVQSLEAHGFPAAELQARVFPPGRKPPESLVEDLLPRTEGLIDVKV
ncbi:MAG: flagellar hook-length control protein FliK, partial [Thermodesulfobacteriota bacterium]